MGYSERDPPCPPAVSVALLALGSGCVLVGFGSVDHTQFTVTADRLADCALANRYGS